MILAVVLWLPLALQAMPVYDDDDRRDPADTDDRAVLALADSTVALFPSDKVTVKDGWAELATKPYSEVLPLCEGERFAGQRVGADCSGALVAPDVILTAGHCVKSKAACGRTFFVFGFRTGRDGTTPTRVPASEVYSCKAIVGRKLDSQAGSDWALIALDRPARGHKALGLDTAAVTKGLPVMVIGHPLGLPAKVAAKGAVRDASPEAYFTTDLDAFHGNSGSPVFASGSRRIVGVLARGDEDFETVVKPDGSKCLRTKVCRNGGCEGEVATKVSEFIETLSRRLKPALPRSEKSLHAGFSSPSLGVLKDWACVP
ncbi:MAG: trypsin-like peptidase domain-containing protein [Elusimicrobia bacterium]|nr:trypsin-like peptidase domain-containing protein [Elusimicrobiota bacterium]